MRANQDIVEVFREALGEERLYFANFRAMHLPPEPEPNPDELLEVVEHEAKQIEKTVGCVTAVTKETAPGFGSKSYDDIKLYAILPRHVDIELFERVIEDARHRALTKTHEGAEP